jgi:electron transport complex protein RnfC
MVLGRDIGQDQIPAAEGILVLNVQTLYSISQAVLKNQPADTRYLTVADLNNKTARVIRVRLGMKLSEIMEAVYPGAFNIFAGGGIMQSKVAEEDSCVDRNINFIATGSFPNYKESPQCSGCAVCTLNCPAGLKVNRIADLVEQGKPKEAAKYHAEECISCGSSAIRASPAAT